jgi:triacylglycerol esterase/lipase EstA (alpha/beta hydrolase family)
MAGFQQWAGGIAPGGMRRVLKAVIVVALVAAGPAAAQAADYAPVTTPGPKLSVPEKELAAALKCSDGVDGTASREPVLMVPGTTLNPDVNFEWNWLRALGAQHIPHCTVRSPDDAMADIQVNGEYIVYAIREMHHRTGQKVQIVGFSQGGMAPRWALRFWPDTRTLVDDLVGLSPSNHGTDDATNICAAGGCAPAIWQQTPNSDFMAALNSIQETFGGVDYTSAYTRDDEVVVPNQDAETGSSSLRTGDGARANIAAQDICPGHYVEHLGMGSYDAVAYAIAMDALTHPGPADPARVDRAACSQLAQPGVDNSTFATDYANYTAYVARVLATYPHVPEEPPLACYATASCPVAPATTRHCVRSSAVTLRLRTLRGHHLERVRIKADGKRLRVRRRHGRFVARIHLRRGLTVVRISARARSGRKLGAVRRYRRCAG